MAAERISFLRKINPDDLWRVDECVLNTYQLRKFICEFSELEDETEHHFSIEYNVTSVLKEN